MGQTNFVKSILLGSAAALGLGSAALAQTVQHRFQIAAQEAVGGLQAFAKQSGKQVLFPYEAVRGKRTPAVTGTMSDVEALSRLAIAAGLVVTSDDGATVTLAPRPQAGAMAAKSEPPAQAESTARAGAVGGMEEIVVTAQKRTENLQDVPIAITAITGDRLSAAGVSNTQELSTIAPGLTMNIAAGAILPRIRGVGQTGVTITLENPVAIYVDGVYFASPSAGIFALSSIEQVAVLKGPQGTLFGRNATGGLIQVTTRDPSSKFGGKADLTIGNLQTLGGSLYLTGPVAPNLTADVAAYYMNQEKGFGRNEFTGRDVNRSKELSLRSKLKFEASDRTTIKLSGDYSRVRAADGGRIADSSLIAAPNVDYPASVGKFDVYSDLDTYSNIDQWGASLTIEHDLDFAKLTMISAYRETDADLVLESDYGPLPIEYITAGQHEKTFTQEVQLVSTADGPLKWTIGAYYFDNRGAFDPPVDIITGSGSLDILIDSSPKTRSIAGYAQGAYALTDRLNITAGLRYTNEKRDISGSSTLVFNPGGALPATLSNASVSDSRPTWRLALDYRFSEEMLGYASYNRGFKSGGFSPTEIPVNKFAPEVVDAFETGLKLDLFDRRLRINPAVYYYDYKNLQVASFENGLQRTRNAAQATIYGLDLDLVARLSSQLELRGGFAWTHARYDEFNSTPLYTPRSQMAGGGNASVIGSAAGNRIVKTPDWTLNVGVNYSIPVGSDELVLNATYFHSDGWFAMPDNRYRQKPYDLVNASATYDVAGPLKFTLWARNLGNTAYGQARSSTEAGDAVTMARGRLFGVTAGVSF